MPRFDPNRARAPIDPAVLAQRDQQALARKRLRIYPPRTAHNASPDWVAIRMHGEEEGPVGRGKTRQAAITDLEQQEPEVDEAGGGPSTASPNSNEYYGVAGIDWFLHDDESDAGVADFRARVTAAQELADQVRSTHQRLTVNSDGTVTLRHATNRRNREAILADGELRGNTWLAASSNAALMHARPKHGGDTTVLVIKVDPRDIEFSTGTGEFYAPVGLVRDEYGVWRSPAGDSALTDAVDDEAAGAILAGINAAHTALTAGSRVELREPVLIMNLELAQRDGAPVWLDTFGPDECKWQLEDALELAQRYGLAADTGAIQAAIAALAGMATEAAPSPARTRPGTDVATPQTHGPENAEDADPDPSYCTGDILTAPMASQNQPGFSPIDDE